MYNHVNIFHRLNFLNRTRTRLPLIFSLQYISLSFWHNWSYRSRASSDVIAARSFTRFPSRVPHSMNCNRTVCLEDSEILNRNQLTWLMHITSQPASITFLFHRLPSSENTFTRSTLFALQNNTRNSERYRKLGPVFNEHLLNFVSRVAVGKTNVQTQSWSNFTSEHAVNCNQVQKIS